jgi:hypothetical protein
MNHTNMPLHLTRVRKPNSRHKYERHVNHSMLIEPYGCISKKDVFGMRI